MPSVALPVMLTAPELMLFAATIQVAGTVDDFKNAEAVKLTWLRATELLPLLSVLFYGEVCENFY